MRLSPFLSFGALAVAAVELGSGDPYVDFLPFQVRKVRPKTPFATNPPIEKCANGIIYMVADALGLERSVLDDMLAQLLGALGALGLDLGGVLGRGAPSDSTSEKFKAAMADALGLERSVLDDMLPQLLGALGDLGLDLGGILRRAAPRDSTSEIPNYFAGVPVLDFKAAMDNMLERTYKDNVTGKPAYDSSSAFTGIWGLRTNIVSALQAIDAIGSDERLVKFVALGALAARAQEQNGGDLEQVLYELRKNLDEAHCADENEDESGEPTAGLCEVGHSANSLELYPRDLPALPSSPAAVVFLGALGLELDIAALPDLLTGFATSRVVYTLIQYVLGQLQVSLDLSAATIDLDATGGNLGAGACRSVGISREFDFDPIWASCAVATLIGAVMGCGATGLPNADCSKASLTPTPDWANCDRVYSASGLDFDPNAPIPLGLTPRDQAFDANGNLLDAAIEGEGFNYYFLFGAAIATTGYANPQKSCEVLPNPLQVVPGWDRVLDVWATQEGDPAFENAEQEFFPVASLSKQGDYVFPFVADGNTTFGPPGSIPYTLEPNDASRLECWSTICRVFDNGAVGSLTALEACTRTLPRDCKFNVGFEFQTQVLKLCDPSSDPSQAAVANATGIRDQMLSGLPEVFNPYLDQVNYTLVFRMMQGINSTPCDFDRTVYYLDQAPTDCADLSIGGTLVDNEVLPDPANNGIKVDVPSDVNFLGIMPPISNNTATWSGCGDGVAFIDLRASANLVLSGDDFYTSSPAPGVCRFLLTQRGTASAYEWGRNFDAMMTPGYNGDGLVHAGYKKYTDVIMPEIEQFIKAEYLDTNECVPSTTYIMVSGHSLGGGLAELYTHYITNSDTFADMEVELVTFAPAHGLNQDATESIRARANVRSLVGEYDLVPFFPCANGGGLMRCNTRTAAILSGEGYDEQYGEHINTITLGAETMKSIDERFADLRFMSIGLQVELLAMAMFPTYLNIQMPASINPAAWHVCSYACWASANFCTTDPNLRWMCDNCPDLQAIGMTTTTSAPTTVTTIP